MSRQAEALIRGKREQTWRRAVHFHLIVFCTGFCLCALIVTLPDRAIEAFGGKGDPRAKGLASFWLGLSNGAKAFAGLVAGPSLGSRSDVHGRKSFVVGGAVMCLLSYLPLLAPAGSTVAFAAYLALNALSGFIPVLPALLTVVTDDQPPERRARGFGFLMAVFDSSFLFVPALTAVLSHRQVNAVVCASGALAVLLVVAYGESLPVEQRVRGEDVAGVQVSRSWWKPQNNCAILISTPLFRRLSLAIFSSTVVMAGSQQCFMLYLETSFGLSQVSASRYIAILALTGLLVQSLILPLVIRGVGLARGLLLALSIQVVQHLLYASVHQTTVIAMACFLGGFGGMVFPIVSALKSLAAAAEQQGQVQGAVSGLQSCALGLGPLLYGSAFAYTSSPGFPFGEQLVFAISLCMLVPAVAVASTLRRYVGDGEQGREDPVRRAVSVARDRSTVCVAD
mmetsp:Transcript_47909/g.138622  ORF Transcript_47909/g.138622 Transcript_47909/m.138622 type:complete len:453 (-) Transcript_47909:85-1443(-)